MSKGIDTSKEVTGIKNDYREVKNSVASSTGSCEVGNNTEITVEDFLTKEPIELNNFYDKNEVLKYDLTEKFNKADSCKDLASFFEGVYRDRYQEIKQLKCEKSLIEIVELAKEGNESAIIIILDKYKPMLCKAFWRCMSVIDLDYSKADEIYVILIERLIFALNKFKGIPRDLMPEEKEQQKGREFKRLEEAKEVTKEVTKKNKKNKKKS